MEKTLKRKTTGKKAAQKLHNGKSDAKSTTSMVSPQLSSLVQNTGIEKVETMTLEKLVHTVKDLLDEEDNEFSVDSDRIPNINQSMDLNNISTSPTKFHLRKLRENAVQFLENQVRISINHRKEMVNVFEQYLDRNVNIKNSIDFFNAFLDIIEEDPSLIVKFWIAVDSKYQKVIKYEEGVRIMKPIFAPHKLSLRIRNQFEEIFESFSNQGVSVLSDLIIFGLFFTYGFCIGNKIYRSELQGMFETIENKKILNKSKAKNSKEDISNDISKEKGIANSELKSKPDNIKTAFKKEIVGVLAEEEVSKHLPIETLDSLNNLTQKLSNELHLDSIIELNEILLNTIDCFLDIEKNRNFSEIWSMIDQILGKSVHRTVFDVNLARSVLNSVMNFEKLRKNQTEIKLKIDEIKAQAKSDLDSENFDAVQFSVQETSQLKLEESQIEAQINEIRSDTKKLIGENIQNVGGKNTSKTVNQIQDKLSKQIETENVTGNSISDESNGGNNLKRIESEKTIPKKLDTKSLSSKLSVGTKSPTNSIVSGEPSENPGKTQKLAQKDKIPKRLLIEEKKIRTIIANLIQTDKLAIASRFAKALEVSDQEPIIPSNCFELAASARISFEHLDRSTQQFVSKIGLAMETSHGNDLAHLIIFGSLLRPAILRPDTTARISLRQLSLRDFGESISDLANVISSLDFTFYPTIESLNVVSGQSNEPRQVQKKTEFIEWVETTSKLKIQCPKSSSLLHKLTKKGGVFRIVADTIQEGNVDNAILLANELVDSFDPSKMSNSKIDDIRKRFKSNSKDRLSKKMSKFVTDILERGRVLLINWVNSTRDGNRSNSGDLISLKQQIEILKATVVNVQKFLEHRDENSDQLTDSVFVWFGKQIENLLLVLNGTMPIVIDDISVATSGELDLLPIKSVLNLGLEEEVKGTKGVETSDIEVITFLKSNSVPSVEDAIVLHCKNGAFRRANRLRINWISDINVSAELKKTIHKLRSTQLKGVIKSVVDQTKSLRQVGKIDLNHMDQIKRAISLLETIHKNLKEDQNLDLDSIPTSEITSFPDDVIEINNILTENEVLIKKVRSGILTNQRERLKDYRKVYPKHAKYIEKLLKRLELQNLDYIEEQLTRIRDDRVDEQIRADKRNKFEEFYPKFVQETEKSDWPNNLKEYQKAFQNDSRILLQKDRFKSACELMQNWFDLAKSIAHNTIDVEILEKFLNVLTFQETCVSRPEQAISNNKVWKFNAKIKFPVQSEYFIPPIFGSRSNDEYAVILAHQSTLIEQIVSELKPNIPQIILIAGKLTVQQRIEIAHQLRKRNIAVILVDEVLAAFISSRTDSRIETLFECGLPFGRIEPYITDAGRLPPEMFFGRTLEIGKIASQSSDGLLVYGGRQLGKSALLAQVEEIYNRPEENFLVIREDIKSVGTIARNADDIWRVIGDKLRKPHTTVVCEDSMTKDSVISDIKNWISKYPRGRILCLLDESDNFLSSEARTDFPNLLSIKSLMEETNRAFKVVLAGLHHVQRMYRSPNSPLAHFGSPVCIGPLNTSKDDRKSAFDLVELPLRAAGFRLPNEDVADQILSFVNFYPSLVQIFMKELIQYCYRQDFTDLGEPLWKIPHDQIFDGEGFKSIESEIRKKFGYTLDLDPKYKLIALVFGLLRWQDMEHEVLTEGLDAMRILKESESFWPEQLETLQITDMQITLDEMFELGILGKIASENSITKYCLQSRQVANMLGSEQEILDELIVLQSVEPPIDYNSYTNRRLMRPVSNVKRAVDARSFSPLTDRELHRLLTDESTVGAHYVSGMDALGLDKVSDSIENYANYYNFCVGNENVNVYTANSSKGFNELMSQIRSKGISKNVVSYRPTRNEIDQLIRYTQDSPEILEGKIRLVIVLDAIDPYLRDIAIRFNAIVVKPWGGEMFRIFLEIIEEPEFKGLREKVLEKTGGIPDEIVRVIAVLNKSEDPEQELENIKISLEPIKLIGSDLIGATKQLLEVNSLNDDNREENQIELFDLAIEDLRKELNLDLETVGHELRVLGILDQFLPNEKKFKISYLGRLISTQ